MSEKPLRITFSVGKKYRDIVYYLETKENISRFVCELIQREMRNDPHEDEIEKKVYKILNDFIENENLTFKASKTSNSSSSNSNLMDEEIDLIGDLFG